MLSIKNLSVTIENHPIITNLNLEVGDGSVHALMGPNGSGKSSLAHVIMGHPRYTVQGEIFYGDTDIMSLSPDKRAQLGIFVAFQHPYELPGVTVFQFLKEAYQTRMGTLLEVKQFQEVLVPLLQSVGLDSSFAHRACNDGFSGGEKKRLELVQMLVLQPSLVILDEIDSGLDVDGLSLVADALSFLRKMTDRQVSFVIITHYQRLFKYIKPDFVHIMHNGSLIQSGDYSLIHELEESGYQPFVNRITQGPVRGASL